MAISKLSFRLFDPLSGPTLTASLVESEDNIQCSCDEIHRRQFVSSPWGELYTLLILCRSRGTRKLAFEIYNTFISNLHNGPLNQVTLFWDMKRICDCQGSVEDAPAEDSDWSMEDDMDMDDEFPRWIPTGSELSVPFTSFTRADSNTSPGSKPERREFLIPPQIRKALKDETKKEGALRMHINGGDHKSYRRRPQTVPAKTFIPTKRFARWLYLYPGSRQLSWVSEDRIQ
ncbi:uncharacterized protein A1O5_00617 [Cladophialophora psammophila CBS 110553]|uniref:Uncharacterized protein n=1 Tax=Cladophialophora psammophila CBS 110553 TaxID=1182543 RepID=W9Y0T3_9EURO|nr:uncharacterized protein A1O5_00617 [Cladophialophora psammophila CBS 110553]EXJ76109.1 hypothetical protein A1O5_00617 [Cladophialophora psammophila CBS 110553]